MKKNITLEHIKKIKKHKYVDNDSILNKEIYSKTIILLRDAHLNVNDNEVLLLLRLQDYAYETCSDNNDTNVSFSESMLNEMYTHDYSYIALHNHPYDGNFSIGDIHQLLMHDRLIGIIAIDNSCRHSYFLIKSENFKYNIINNIAIKILDMLISKNIVSMHSDSKYLIEFFKLSKYIIYKQYTNY